MRCTALHLQHTASCPIPPSLGPRPASPAHAHEVWREADGDLLPSSLRQALLDLRHVSVLADAVRVDALRNLNIQVGLLGAAPCTTHTCTAHGSSSPHMKISLGTSRRLWTTPHPRTPSRGRCCWGDAASLTCVRCAALPVYALCNLQRPRHEALSTGRAQAAQQSCAHLTLRR